MPQLPRYEYTGLVDCSIPPSRAVLKEKSVIVTGGMCPAILSWLDLLSDCTYRRQWHGRGDGARFCSRRVRMPGVKGNHALDS